MPIKNYFKYLASQLDFEYKLAKRISKDVVAFFVKPFMKKIAETPDFGTLDWVEKHNKNQCVFRFKGRMGKDTKKMG